MKTNPIEAQVILVLVVIGAIILLYNFIKSATTKKPNKK